MESELTSGAPITLNYILRPVLLSSIGSVFETLFTLIPQHRFLLLLTDTSVKDWHSRNDT